MVNLKVAALGGLVDGLVSLLGVAVRGWRMPCQVFCLRVVHANALGLLAGARVRLWTAYEAIALPFLELRCCFEVLGIDLLMRIIPVSSIFLCLHSFLGVL